MIIENEREAIRQRPEGQHAGVICPRAAVHQRQWEALPHDFDEERNVSNRDGRHWLLPLIEQPASAFDQIFELLQEAGGRRAVNDIVVKGDRRAGGKGLMVYDS
jgi:hypothetical protein